MKHVLKVLLVIHQLLLLTALTHLTCFECTYTLYPFHAIGYYDADK